VIARPAPSVLLASTGTNDSGNCRSSTGIVCEYGRREQGLVCSSHPHGICWSVSACPSTGPQSIHPYGCPSFVHPLSVCLPIYLFIYLSIYLSIYLPTYLSIYLSICLSVYLPIYLSIYLSTYLPTYLSIYIYIYMYLSICLSVCLSIYLSICLSLSLFWPAVR